MFLKCLDIVGFKSFADKTHIDFADGITSLLGPNGCGKSNIVDSIKWVLGEQSTKTLRAGRMEDVIFNGTDKRKPLQYAEVALTIDNSERNLPTDLTEVEIKRRVFRSGESEYYINKNRCLLKNIRELFFDTGVGKSAYSILEQGKIDQILSQRPEDRRYIFEEAAGISRFKMECNEASKKIERTDENINQAESLMKVEKRSYESLKTQAEKAKSYNELVKRQLSVDVDIHYSKLKTYLALKDMRSERNKSLAAQVEALKSSLESFRVNIEEEQARMQSESQKSHSLQYAINRNEEAVNSRNDKIAFLESTYRDYINAKKEAENRAESIKSSLDRDKSELERMQAELDEKHQILEESQRQVKRANLMLSDDLKLIDDFKAKVNEEENLISENEEVIEKLGASLKEVVDSLASELDKMMGERYSFKRRSSAEKNFNDRLDMMIRDLKEKAELQKSISSFSDKIISFENIISALQELKNDFLSYKETIPPFIDSFLSPDGLLTKKREISDKEALLRDANVRSREKIVSFKSQISSLEVEVDNLRDTIKNMEIQLASVEAGISSFKAVKDNLERSIDEKEISFADSQSAITIANSRIEATANQLRQADSEKAELLNQIIELKKQLKELQDEINERYSALSSKEKEKNDTIDKINYLNNEIEKNELWINNTQDLIQNLYASFYNTYSRNLKEFEDRMDAELGEQVLLENELTEIKKQLQTLGPNINHMAVDEFEGAKERYEFLQKQLDDMYKSKHDLETVLAEIETRSKEMFLNTYKQISENFQVMFRRLFGGGRAEITLQDPENVLTSGIDIFAQPPGKKLISLTLLSGGERSMTAVALLFATYMVKPSPFCILDEIDAALDDKNIGFFLSVLEDFAKDSQFIIITHNKHTVMGSASLLGVTQMEAGVSTTVSYKLARIKGEAVILNENDNQVDFDSEGRRT